MAISKRRFIPEEVLEEILVRLNVKSLYKLKLVCRSWLRLINSPSFIHFYRIHGSRSEDALTCVPLSTLPIQLTNLQRPCNYAKKEEEEGEQWACVVHPMGPLNNGIYCLVSNLEWGGRVSVVTGKICLCNPSTRTYKFIEPSSPIPFHAYNKDSRFHYGFGQKQKDDDYKVVLIVNTGSLFSSMFVYVYSVKRGEWRKRSDERGRCPEITSDVELCSQRFFRGCIHWVTVYSTGRCGILSFNVDDETFKSMDVRGYSQIPNFRQHAESCLKGTWVTVLKDRLSLIYTLGSRIHVYMMMEYGAEESWRRIYAVDHGYGSGVLSKLVGIYWKPKTGYGDDEEIQSMSFVVDCGRDKQPQLVSFSESGHHKHLGVYDTSSTVWWNTIGISVYRESLEPL